MYATFRSESIFKNNISLEKWTKRGAWVAQSVKRPTLSFSSGHDLTGCPTEPRERLCAGGVEPAWDSLSASLSVPSLLVRARFLSRNKSINFLKKRKKNKQKIWQKFHKKENSNDSETTLVHLL